MMTPAEPVFNSSKFDEEAVQAVIALSDGLARTIHIARVLLLNGRAIDLTGLDRGTGLLCAKALDLPFEAGRSIRAHLQAVLLEADWLEEALRCQSNF